MSDEKVVKDRFELPEQGNLCESCRWMNEVNDTEFPCTHCVHNPGHV